MSSYPFFLLSIVIAVIIGGVSACTGSYNNPSQEFDEADLVGVWEADYGEDQVDRLTIREDGSYKQTFGNLETGYIFETEWNPWWIVSFADGSVYIHFDKGRYYAAGIRIAELDGMGDPCPTDLPNCIAGNNPRPFYDPYTEKPIEMVNELVLTLRVDARGTIIFHHMWTSIDRGFALIGGQMEIFRLTKSP